MKLTVKGFKSHRDGTSIELRPLTVLCGANSSGKSSVLQPLLLLKQTLEATFDPGPLLLEGPNVKFSDFTQLLWKGKGVGGSRRGFEIGIERGTDAATWRFENGRMGPEIGWVSCGGAQSTVKLRPGMSGSELKDVVAATGGRPLVRAAREYRVQRDRSSLRIQVTLRTGITLGHSVVWYGLTHILQKMIHVPGLRGNPERSYPTTGVGNHYPGIFPEYVASIVASWGSTGNELLRALNQGLSDLGLTWTTRAERIAQTRVELRVGRVPRRRKGVASDLVNLADVGVGVSQVLPVIVGLLVATDGQLVFLEQPEIHLHPRAQVKLAKLLVKAANRGVIVVAETHSHLLLRGIQQCVAAGEIAPQKVALHWFQRDAEGATQVRTADLDRKGAYCDWPEDFGESEREIDDKLLDTVYGSKG